MTHPEETAPASLAEAAASNCMPVGTIAWDNVKRETEKAIRLALSASPLAKEGGDDEETKLENRIDIAVQAMSETHHSWEARCHAIMAALGFNFGWATPRVDEEPSPALAKGGDAVRERIARALNGVLGSEGDEHPRNHPAQNSSEKPTEVWWTQWLEAADAVLVALSTPTEGPASQTEGMGGEPEQDYPDMEEHGLDEPLEEALREILLGGQGDDNGAQIMPDFQEGQSVPSMVHACIALLETRRDVIEGYANTEAQLRHRIAALTPPETAEAVPVGPFVVMSANYSRPFMLGCYDTLNQAVMAQCGSPEKWHVFSRHPVSDPEAARLREELARVKQENAALREGRHLADNALVDRYRDPKTGSFQFPTDVAAIVRRFDATERERDDAVKALEMARAATASDPAPATDDRERLVEALRKAEGLLITAQAYVPGYLGTWQRDWRLLRAALATEASR